MKFKAYPLEHIDRLLEPGPVVMVTTAKGEKQNIMTMAWHTMMEFTPPLVGCVISNRDYTFSLIAKTKECVLAIPTRDIAATVVKVGN
ncbi:MAG TPA: flavin reductase, partial [Patescibacteria group bacterium]|nr:flavin reductase [Patescibacteria group bacterium]